MSEFVVNSLTPADKSTTSRWIFTHLSRHKLLLLIIFIGSFGNAALAALVPVLVGVAFNAVLADPIDVPLIGWAALGILVSQTIRAVLQFGRNFSSAVTGERMERDMREELYVSLLGKSMTFHDLQPVGDTMARATNDVHELNLMIYPGMNLVIGSANFMIMPLLLAPRYDWALILAPLFFIVTYVLALIRYLHTLNPITDRVREAFGALNGRLAEAIDGVEMVKGSAQETAEIDRFLHNAADYRDATVEQGKVEARFLPLLLLGMTQAIGFAHSLFLYRQGRLEPGGIAAANFHHRAGHFSVFAHGGG